MRLARRWTFTIAAVVIAVVALAVSRLGLFGPSSEECRPVKDLLAFNTAQAEQIASKTADSKGVPTVAEEGAYQAWADGLAERAQNVHEPDLAATPPSSPASRTSSSGKFSEVRIAAQSQAPGAPAPPAVFQMDLLNTQIADS